MPELPEVETIRLGLQKYLVGHKIIDVDIKEAKLFQGDKKNIIGGKIVEVERVGKGLIICLDNAYCFAVHLKLTGQLIYSGRETRSVILSEKAGGTLPSKFTYVTFKFDHGAFLYFNDMRKFGWIKVGRKTEIKNLPFFKGMGPEPLKDLTLKEFSRIIRSSARPVKLLLMDQSKIGGIGNIYANESLYVARINPGREAKNLSDQEIVKLFNSILKVLKTALRYGGSSDANFVNAAGKDGVYQDHFLVYGRKSKNCVNCQGKIKKIQLAGRGTYFCPHCQK